MAPAPVTEDYYVVLGLDETATTDLVIRSYKRLALKLHPDRNPKHNATESFQLLAIAYETLKDASKRREYDLIYPSIARNRSSPSTTQTPGPPPASTTQSEASSEAVQIAALQKSKQDRAARWWPKKKVFDSSIFELQRKIRQLEQEIKTLDSIAAAEAAEEAQKNSWGAWLLSPIYKKAIESEEVKVRKSIERQERRMEKDMKERRLWGRKTDLMSEENLLRKAEEEVNAADLADERKIRAIQDMVRAEEARERQERERIVREKMERDEAIRIRKQQEQFEKIQRELDEAYRKRKEEAIDAARRREEDLDRNWYQAFHAEYQDSKTLCNHGGWWAKVHGRTTCPKCYVSWTYLLECPGCMTKACPKCQKSMRPPGGNYRGAPHVRNPGSFSSWDY